SREPGAPSRSTTRTVPPRPAQCTSARSGPSSEAASRAAVTCSGSVTSAGAKRQPRSAATCSPGEPGRSAMTTFAPPSVSRAAVARPSPEAPPVTSATDPSTFTVLSSCSQTFDDGRVGHPAGLAHGLQAPAAAGAAQVPQHAGEEPAAGGAERMTERDGAADRVQHLVGDRVLGLPGQGDGRERLVDLGVVDVGEAEPGAL